ncbi:MAG: T9SS C-terminal target domain-containing protein [Balneola sp.]|nr:MAG: T9SS C-terminal target domain-containing protein [Balneola sp.]
MINATIKRLATFALVMIMMVGFANTTFAQNTLYGENIILDGDFSADTLSSNWATDINSGATATIGVTNNELSITDIVPAGNQWNVQAIQILSADQISALGNAGTIELTFDARTTADTKTFHVFLGENGGTWARYWQSPGDGDVTVTNSMETYTLVADVDETWENMKFGFEVATDTSSLFIDNIVVRSVNDNILFDGGFAGDTLSSNWGTVTTDGAAATFSNTDGQLAITDITSTGTTFHIQAFQEFTQDQIDSVYAGPYEIFFDARAEATKSFTVYFGENVPGGGWTNFGGTIEVGTEMQTYSMQANATGNFPMMKFGFEVGSDASSVYFDNVIVRRVREIKPEAPTFGLATENGVVTISADDQSDAAMFEVFFSDTAFTTTDGGVNVGTIDPANGLTLDHSTLAPHPTLVDDFTAYYGVVAVTGSGTESDLVVSSIETSMGVQPNYISEISADDADAIFTAVDTETFPDAATIASYFPEGYQPFTINSENRSIENGTGGDGDADISGQMWVGFETGSGADFMIIYAEIMDDILVPAPLASGGNGAWNFDSWEMGIGAYAPESFIRGSDHDAFEIGDEPDYQFRAGFFSDAAPFISAWDGGAGSYDQLVPNSATLGDSSQAGMYRLLTIVSTIQFSTVNTTSVNFDFPTGTGVTTVPFQFALNDNDATSRDTQISWSPLAGQDDWWNTPSRWVTVAMTGLDASFTVSNEEDPDAESPYAFSLEQNYPNPFNPSTNIEFTLASASNVTLEVYNMLGQKVATLLDGERLSAGSHQQLFNAANLSSGMYLYRLSTESFSQSRKMMLIK